MKSKSIIIFLALLCLTACGEKSGPKLTANFECKAPGCDAPESNPFKIPSLNDVVVQVESVANPNLELTPTFLDGFAGTEPDGSPDTIVFPAACSIGATPLAAGCGFPASEVQNAIDLTGIPLIYSYILRVQGRDAAGNPVFEGVTPIFPFTATLTTLPTIVVTTSTVP